MITIGLFDAKAQLGQLARSAASGEVVVLTKRGKPVAEIRAPQSSSESDEHAKAAISALRRWRQQVKIAPFDIAELVNEGRRG